MIERQYGCIVSALQMTRFAFQLSADLCVPSHVRQKLPFPLTELSTRCDWMVRSRMTEHADEVLDYGLGKYSIKFTWKPM